MLKKFSHNNWYAPIGCYVNIHEVDINSCDTLFGVFIGNRNNEDDEIEVKIFATEDEANVFAKKLVTLINAEE